MKHILGPKSKSLIHNDNLNSNQIQPNAVDLTVKKILKIDPNSEFYLSEDNKIHRSTVEVVTYKDEWHLVPGAYEVVMNEEVSIGDNEAGWVVSRSTLVRNGCFIVSGIYDTGYKGAIGGCLHVNGGDFILKKNTRVGQFILFDAEALHKYTGSYGNHAAHDSKYK